MERSEETMSRAQKLSIASFVFTSCILILAIRDEIGHPQPSTLAVCILATLSIIFGLMTLRKKTN
jgi:hypothetical protein